MKSYSQIGTEIGELVERKNAAYGSSFAKAGEFLRLLYPEGLQPDQYDYALLLVRDFDKSMRIATDNDAFGESPWADKAGYAILGVHLHQQSGQPAEERTECDGVSGAVTKRPREQRGSVEINASAPTTTSASVARAHEPMTQPDGIAFHEESAPAPNATAAASPSEVADLKPLVDAIRQRATEIYNGEAGGNGDLADAKDIACALARILGGHSLRAAFGSPGDWGYGHPIGKALYSLYSDHSSVMSKVIR